MRRKPEPAELMDDPTQAEAYATTDFEEPNALFMEQFARCFPHGPQGLPGAAAQLLDLGCGPADITVRLACRYPACQATGVDGAEAMLRFGREAVTRARLQGRVHLLRATLPLETLPCPAYDTIVSNSLLHHLMEPAVLWDTVARFGRSGTQVLVMDLFRPVSPAAAETVVKVHAGDAPQILRRDFYNSLCAAFRPSEVRGQLQAAGLEGLEVKTVSDRHLLICGCLP